MYNYYINEELIEQYPKGSPRAFKFGETHRIEVINAEEDESTRVDNEESELNKYPNYNYKISRQISYGSIESQIEYITENGIEAWQEKVTEIKSRYPKPS